jgi:unsaturated rhamnogalacturonyl hydrolase
MNKSLDVVKTIGDKLIRDTPFRYRLEVAPVNHDFSNETTGGLQFVDFGRTFGLGKPAMAFAYTRLNAPVDMDLIINVEHSDGCKIWLNGEVVYRRNGNHRVHLIFDERSIEMSSWFNVSLRKGPNTLLIKSETRGDEWRVYLQPPSLKGAVLSEKTAAPIIGLAGVPDVDSRIAGLTNWLVCGPFANPDRDLDRVHELEREFRFGFMYPGLNEPVTWTVPKIEILGSLIDPHPWGTNYNWNYHNGGVAWAMQQLSEVTGDERYNDYASRFCDFHLLGGPFVSHQVKTLNAINSANHFFLDSPLLDFTLAPALPFIYRLRQDNVFAHRDLYESFIGRMIEYARSGQVRLPEHGIYTRTTPVKYTTWVDDMFMGIPFLVQAALYLKDPLEQRGIMDDAAAQVLEFNSQVWDEEASLYMHARIFGKTTKLPHWSRCNGWGIWAMSDVLMNLGEDHPKRAAILAHYRKHAESLARLQDSSGFWFNVLDRPDSPKEVSGTAIFTLAMARGVRLGWLDAGVFTPVIKKAWQAIESSVETDGTVHGICVGTMCSEDVEFYVQRPFYDNDTHGLFAVLFAGIEMARLPGGG